MQDVLFVEQDFRELGEKKDDYPPHPSYLYFGHICHNPHLYKPSEFEWHLWKLAEQHPLYHENGEYGPDVFVPAFLQHFCYRIIHTYNDKRDGQIKQNFAMGANTLLEKIISHRLFFGEKERPIIWIDRKLGFTVLHAAALYGPRPDFCQTILGIASHYCAHSEDLHRFISHVSKSKHNALHSAVSSNLLYNAEIILKEAKRILGRTTPSIRNFLFSKIANDFTCFMSAANDGNHHLIELLLNTAEECFLNDIEYIKFIYSLINDRDARCNMSFFEQLGKHDNPSLLHMVLGRIKHRIDSQDFKDFIAKLNDKEDPKSFISNERGHGKFQVISVLQAFVQETLQTETGSKRKHDGADDVKQPTRIMAPQPQPAYPTPPITPPTDGIFKVKGAKHLPLVPMITRLPSSSRSLPATPPAAASLTHRAVSAP